MTSVLLAHGVMAADACPALAGLSVLPGAPLRVVATSALLLVATEVAADRAEALFADAPATAEAAVAHHQLLTTLADQCDVAPIRLGAVYGDAGAAAAMLRQEEARFVAALAQISGAAEFAVKLLPADETATATPSADTPASGRAFLRRRSEAETARADARLKARQTANTAFESLARHARAHVFQSPRRHAAADQEKRLLDAALLVSKSEIAAFGLAVIAAQQAVLKGGYRLSVAGPLPAYSFVASEAA